MIKTIKEFQQKKLEIITKIVIAFNNETEPRFIEDKVAILDLVKYLDPPRLTCTSCTHCEPILTDHGAETLEACGECSNLNSRFYRSVITKESDICIHHSAYDDAK